MQAHIRTLASARNGNTTIGCTCLLTAPFTSSHQSDQCFHTVLGTHLKPQTEMESTELCPSETVFTYSYWAAQLRNRDVHVLNPRCVRNGETPTAHLVRAHVHATGRHVLALEDQLQPQMPVVFFCI